MQRNKKGFSLIGLLLIVVILLTLTSILLKQTTQKGTPKKSQLNQTLEQVQATVKQAEQAASQRANLDRNFYK